MPKFFREMSVKNFGSIADTKGKRGRPPFLATAINAESFESVDESLLACETQKNDIH